MKKLSILLFIVLATVAAALAQQMNEVDDLFELSLEELMQISISVGSKTISSTDATPGTVYLIDRDKIDRTNAQNLRELLNVYVPGLEALPTYYKYGNSSTGIYNRGILSDFNQQVLILWNGENKFNDATFASPHLMIDFPLDNVERIEINSSSPSPLLGGSAMMTINIVTSEKELSGVSAHANVGFGKDGFMSKRFSTAFGQEVGEWKVGGGLQYFDNTGFEYKPEGEDVTDSYYGLRNGNKGSVSFQLNVQSPDSKLEIGSSYRNIVNDAFLSGLTYSESSDLYKYQGKSFMNYIKYKPIEGLEISAGYSNQIFNNFVNLEQFIPIGVNQTENIPYGMNITNGNFYLQSNYITKFSLAGDHTLLSGIRFENEGQSDHAIVVLTEENVFEDQTAFREEVYGVEIPNGSRNIYTAFVEDNWEINSKLSALLALRGDVYLNYNDVTTEALNPRIGLVYSLSDKLLLKGLYATAVRPPSLYEIGGSKFLPLLYGDKKVGLEQLSTFEFNLLYTGKKAKVRLTGYHSNFENRISYQPSELDTTISIASNSGKTEIMGLEFISEYDYSDNGNLFLNMSYVFSEDKTRGVATPFIPRLFVNGGVFQRIKSVDLIGTFSYRGERELPQTIQFERNSLTSSHFNLDFTARYHISKQVNVYFMIQNALNNENWVPLSQDGLAYPLNPRTLLVGMNIRM